MYFFIRIVQNISLSISIVAIGWYLIDTSPVHRQIARFILFGQGELKEVCVNSSCLTSDEITHLQSVQYRVWGIYILALTTTLLLPHLPKDPKTVQKSKLMLAVTMVIVLIAASNFNAFFEIFHYVVFPEGNWSFHINSLLIQTYPEYTWRNAGAIVVLLCSLLELRNHLTKEKN